MSGGKLVVKQSFGINPIVKNCISFAEEHHLAYASGNQVAVINIESKEQGFISGTNTYQHQSLGITAVVASIGKKIIAVAEKVEPSAIVTFYDAHTLRKRKLLSYPELGSNEIRCIAFSDDGRFLITQGCGPEWNLVLWNIEKSIKVLTSVKISLTDDNPVHQISFCPWDCTVILVIGKSILRLFRYIEGQLRPISLTVRREQANYLSYCWLPEEILLLGTETGEILLVENLEYRGVIYPPADNPDAPLTPIQCICPTARGFVIGSNEGLLKIFERRDEIKEKFEVENVYKIPGDVGNIHTFAITDDILAVGTDRRNLLTISMSNLKGMLEGHKDSGNGFEHVLTPFHGPNGKGECGIIAIDTAIWKNIVVTCGQDRTVRVWNPVDKKIELMKQFDEDPISLSVHPSGIYVAVAFPDKIKIFSLLLDDIYCCREIVARQCSYIKFSRGGQYIASANGTHLQIYNTFTGAPSGTLRGHNNKIKNVMWMNNDSRMMTVGSEGVVYFWDLFPVNRRPEHYSGTVPVSCGVAPSDGTRTYVATHDKLIKELNFTHLEVGALAAAAAVHQQQQQQLTVSGGVVTSVEAAAKITKDLELSNYISCMVYDEARKMLLLGTNVEDGPGTIITTLTSPNLSAAYDLNIIHNGAVTAMCLSRDGNALFSGDANGCLIVSEYENAAFSGGKTPGKIRDGLVSFEFVEEVLIQKSDLESRKSQISFLTQKVQELNHNIQYQLRLKDMEHNEKMDEINTKFNAQLQVERVKYEELEAEKSIIEKEFAKKVKNLENKQIDELRQIELKYKLKQNNEENRHKILVEETEDAHRRWNEENQALVASHQAYLQELTIDYEEKLMAEQRAQKNIHSEKERLQVHCDLVKNDTENDGDREVAEMKIKYDAKLKQEEETGIELMAQHALLKKDLQIRNKDSNQQKEEIKRLKDKETRLYETIHLLEKDIQSHKKEIREREETITDKEKRIFDLKKKNQELEKFRFVLDYKIKELKLQIKPRETEINTMRKQIEEMNMELEQYHKSNLSLNLVIEELKLKLDGVKHELNSQTQRYDMNYQLMERFKRDLQELWLKRHDQTAFKANVINMYQVYVQEDVSAGPANKSKEVEDPQQVYNRDREQMERSLDSLRRSLKTEALAHKRDLGKMMRESVLLTKELNTLRKNARSMQLQMKAINAAGEIGPNTDLAELMNVLGLHIKKVEKIPGRSTSAGKAGGAAGGGGDALGVPPTPPAPEYHKSSRHATPSNRTTALRTTQADGKVNRSGIASRHDQWEAWREIQMQYEHMKQLEEHLTSLCHACNIDPDQLIVGIDSNLALM